MGKKKKFITKKDAITFRLLHRSQKDPLVTDENAPQHVLHPLEDGKNDDKKELSKFGIYFDDGYDYMQHLKERTGHGELMLVSAPPAKSKSKTGKNINLPSSVFPSDVEEKVGMLNRAPPQSGLNLDLDPDIVAAMDSDFDFSDSENELEDDFMKMATGGGGEECNEDLNEEENSFSDDKYSDEDLDEVMSLMERRTNFTEYSMSSSVMRRNEQLTLLDDRFEEMFAEYDDNEIGALDTEEIEGDGNAKILDKFIDNFDIDQDKNRIDLTPPEDPEVYKNGNYEYESNDDDDFEYQEVKPKREWDCESILTTNSTLYNHPKLISAPPSKIRVNSKGIAINSMKLTENTLAKLDISHDDKPSGPKSIASVISLLSIRYKNESGEEKKSRKTAFREFKKERRIEKKLNTQAFKEEKKKMEKMNAHNKSKFQIAL